MERFFCVSRGARGFGCDELLAEFDLPCLDLVPEAHPGSLFRVCLWRGGVFPAAMVLVFFFLHGGPDLTPLWDGDSFALPSLPSMVLVVLDRAGCSVLTNSKSTHSSIRWS